MTLLHGPSIHLNKSFTTLKVTFHEIAQPSIQLNKSFTTLKVTFHEIAQAYFLSPKFDNVLSTFFVGHLDRKLPLC